MLKTYNGSYKYTTVDTIYSTRILHIQVQLYVFNTVYINWLYYVYTRCDQ
jgi:hypothetical protein